MASACGPHRRAHLARAAQDVHADFSAQPSDTMASIAMLGCKNVSTSLGTKLRASAVLSTIMDFFLTRALNAEISAASVDAADGGGVLDCQKLFCFSCILSWHGVGLGKGSAKMAYCFTEGVGRVPTNRFIAFIAIAQYPATASKITQNRRIVQAFCGVDAWEAKVPALSS